MKTAKATLSNFRQAPRKMRMVANTVRGKKVSQALIDLEFTAKKASLPLRTLIASALANAKALEIPTENLVIKTIKVDSGAIMYRRMPAAQGSAHPIRKRTSQIFVELGEAAPKKGSRGKVLGSSEKANTKEIAGEETKKPKGRKKSLAPKN